MHRSFCRVAQRSHGAPLVCCVGSTSVAIGGMARAPSQLIGERHFSHSYVKKPVDLRSDTVTMPSKAMFEASLNAPLGDDVMGDDPTVLELEAYMADMFGKEKGLYVPTGTMANLVAILSHCHTRAAEIIIGSQSHLCLWEGGHVANLGGVHTMQVQEDENARMSKDAVRDSLRLDIDDHWPETKVLCLENTHNSMGGVVLPPSYMDEMASLAHEMNIQCHVDGARIFNSAISQNVSVGQLCKNVDSVSICLSKGLGAPLGSVLVGETEFIRLAKRARKRCGGGMRQVGVVAAMGLYAVQNNVSRLQEDHTRAQRLATALKGNGFFIPRNGEIDTNIVYFGLPDNSAVTIQELGRRLKEDYGVLLTGGYSVGGKLFRLVTHMGVNDADIDFAIESILTVCKSV